MLKRIETSELTLGMFIQKLEGSWFKHPFWKSRFVLDEQWMLEVLQGSAVETVIIDTEQGLDSQPDPDDVPARMPGLAAAPPPAAARSAPLRPVTTPFAAARIATVKEFGTARKIADRHSKVVSRVFLEARLGRGISARNVDPLIDDIYASVQRNLYAFNGLLRCREDSEETYRHALATSALMIALARQMNLSPSETREAGMAGLLMDIGAGQETAGTPSAMAGADDARSQHVLVGHALLKAAGDIPEPVLKVCLRHHERLDGSGFPHQLAGQDIDQLSRMAAICDSYDLLVAGSNGSGGLDPAEAIRHLGDHGQGLDPAIMVYFIEMLGIYPIGAFVELRSGRLAMVVDEDPSERALPTVYTFWSRPQNKRLKGETIELSQCYGADEIVGIAQLGGLDLPPLGALRQTLLSAYAKASGA